MSENMTGYGRLGAAFAEEAMARRRLLVRVRHMRSTEDIDALLSRAQVRRERRNKAVMERQGWFPSEAHARLLDLAHEAHALVLNLEDKRSDAQDRAAYQQMEDRYLG